MMNEGSLDSIEKSQLNSSTEDNQSYDVYEAHNPRYSPSTSDFKVYLCAIRFYLEKLSFQK